MIVIIVNIFTIDVTTTTVLGNNQEKMSTRSTINYELKEINEMSTLMKLSVTVAGHVMQVITWALISV